MTPATHHRLAELRAPARAQRLWPHLALCLALAATTATLTHTALKSARALSEDIARATAEGVLP